MPSTASKASLSAAKIADTLLKARSRANLALFSDACDGGKLTGKPSFAAQRAVMRDAETVRLVAHTLHQVQAVAAFVKHDRVLPVGQVQFLVTFGQADHRQVDPAVQHCAPGKQQLLGRHRQS